MTPKPGHAVPELAEDRGTGQAFRNKQGYRKTLNTNYLFINLRIQAGG